MATQRDLLNLLADLRDAIEQVEVYRKTIADKVDAGIGRGIAGRRHSDRLALTLDRAVEAAQRAEDMLQSWGSVQQDDNPDDEDDEDDQDDDQDDDEGEDDEQDEEP
jgi:hypothetical protein